MAPRLAVASTCNGRILYGCLAATLDQEPSRSNTDSRFHEHNARLAHARDPDRHLHYQVGYYCSIFAR